MKPSALLRLYPRSWRQRYGEEFLALLNEIGASPAQVMDIVRAAIVERVRAGIGRSLPDSFRGLRDAAPAIFGSVVAGTLIALVANIIAFALHARYGQLPSFNSRITEGIPAIAYPPTILPTLFWYARLTWLILPRVVLSGGPVFCLSRWLRVSRVELVLWGAVLIVSATAAQLEMFATAGDPGFPFYSRSEIFFDSWPECLALCLYLAASTRAFWDTVLRSRERARMRLVPGDFSRISRLGL